MLTPDSSSSKSPAEFCPPGWKTDDELEKGYVVSDEDKEFFHFHREIRENHNLSSHEIMELVMRRWPDDKGMRHGYFDWRERYYSRYFDSFNQAWTLDDFCNNLAQTDFGNFKSLARWVWTMEQAHLPFMPFGQVNWGGYETGFGLLPSSGYIHPHVDGHRSRNDELLHRSIIATNDIVIKPTTPDGRGGDQMQPSRPSKASDAKVLGRLNCRIFAQLGSLYVFDGDRQKAKDSEQDIRKGPWRSTGFGVLLELGSRGRQLGVHVMWNFFGELTKPDGSTTRRHIETADAQGKRLPHIGFVHEKCNIHTRFVMEKIAHSLADFQSREKLVTFTSLSDGDPFPKDEIQVVRVKHLNDAVGGRIMLPQFVKD
ncbi:hypothetical protein CkaCkLH20_10428 [Colletotrichum karsti]|uniref:Uncharacterized protein n=1 Tax=Colletotrichum karsti TaxID=1095194 RepID=A0A9P6I140_9PEZI|nr:uncharacterized protein CkaCkLH20_10428 [Colletotrichum karsti]KAF9872091.1 hypothetical protein CkaCkLH20_10428 [Colletotrichum karsti]